jgi:hypothetical protein
MIASFIEPPSLLGGFHRAQFRFSATKMRYPAWGPDGTGARPTNSPALQRGQTVRAADPPLHLSGTKTCCSCGGNHQEDSAHAVLVLKPSDRAL